MDPSVLRSFERILAVAIGGLSIVLGYRLFLALPTYRDATGSIKLPWNISVVVSRVGPGVFFALFGAAVVGLALHSAISVTSEWSGAQRREQGGADRSVVNFRGIGPGGTEDAESPNVRRLQVEGYIRALNRLPLRLDLSPQDVKQTARHLGKVKLALMRTVWDASEWGEFTLFAAWVDNDEPEPIPEIIKMEAVTFFRTGTGAVL